MKHSKTKWGCCDGHVDELLDQGYHVPSTSRTDRQIILHEIDCSASLAENYRRRALEDKQRGWDPGHWEVMQLAYSLVAANLSVSIGIASSLYRCEERLKHFREWSSRIRPVVGLKPGSSAMDEPDKQRAGAPAQGAVVGFPAAALCPDETHGQDARATITA